MSDSPSLQMERVRARVLALLQGAAATVGHPLFGVNVPEHRFGNVMTERWPFLKVRVTRASGEGVSHETPEYVVTGTFQVGGAVEAPRSTAPALDTRALTLAGAVETTVLEDPVFLALFAWTPRFDTVLDDDVAARDGAEVDVVFFQVEIDVIFQATFEPRDPADLSAGDVVATFQEYDDQSR